MNSMKPKQFLTLMTNLAILTSLLGCAPHTDAKPEFCASYRLITIAPQDTLTPRTAETILHDDDQYVAICQQ